MFNINTALKQLEHWVAPKEIQKSGFGKLKIEGQEVTVCTKTAADMHKIGEQLHRLSNLNKTQGKQNWEGNKANVRELEGQINELGATLEGMKLASSQLKTRGDIKAAIKFTKEIDSKAVQIKNTIDSLMTKVDQKTQIDLLKVTQTLRKTTDINGEARADLNEMKVSKHVKPQYSGFSLLTVFQAFREFPAIEALIQTLFQKLDAQAQEFFGTSLKTHLNNHYTALNDSFLKIKEVSTKITSSTEANELLQRVQEARGQVKELTGAANAILTLSFFLDDEETALIPVNLGVMGTTLESTEAILTQKRDLFKHLETLAPLQAAFDQTHEFDLATIGQLLIKITDLKKEILPNPRKIHFEIYIENRKVYENLTHQIEYLEAEATRLLRRFGGISIASEEPTGEKKLRHHVTVAHLIKASQRLEERLQNVTQHLEKNPGKAQHQLAALTKDLERLVELQQHISGEKAELIAYRASIKELGTSLKQFQIKVESALEIEAIRLKGLGKGLTVVFQELNRIAADHLTPETERLREIKAQRNVAVGITQNLEESTIQPSSPNYSQNKAELSQARRAIAMADALISSAEEKILAEIKAIGADQTLPADKKLQELQRYKNKLLPGFLPEGGGGNALDSKNSDRANELNRMIDGQIEIIADRAAIMTAARNDMAVVQVFSEGIAALVENPNEEIWKFERSFDEERANETFTQLQQALRRLSEHQKALGAGSTIENQEIDHVLEHGTMLSARYQTSVESKNQKEVETIFQRSINGMRKQLEYIRLSTSGSTLEKTIVSLTKLNQEAKKLMEFLNKPKFPLNNKKNELINFNNKEVSSDHKKLKPFDDYKKELSQIKSRLNKEQIFNEEIYFQLDSLKKRFGKEPTLSPEDPYTNLIEDFKIRFTKECIAVENRVLKLPGRAP